MATHSRCRHCGSRKKLPRHPLEYLTQPRCHNCGSRDWRKDEYRHRVELPMMRKKQGRYMVCHADCFYFPHRFGCIGCKFREPEPMAEAADD